MAKLERQKCKVVQRSAETVRDPLLVEGQITMRTARRSEAVHVWALLQTHGVDAVARLARVSPMAVARYALELPVPAAVADQIESTLLDAAA